MNTKLSLEEITAMAGGSVEGNAGPAKKKNINILDRKKLHQEVMEMLQNNEFPSKIKSQIMEELTLRTMIQNIFLSEKNKIAGNPYDSTGINVLVTVLKKVIPIIEADYKSLTTDQNQRKSFRSHLLKGIESLINRLKMTENAEEAKKGLVLKEIALSVGGEEGEPPAISDDENQEKFIDINGEMQDSEEEQDNFSIPGEDETGRNMARSTFNQIESSISDSFLLLSNEQDRELFHDYLMANLKLYFDRFESDLSKDVSEPETGDEEAQNPISA